MPTTKVKTYSNISLEEVKSNLRIDSSDDSYDAELLRLIKSAVLSTEKRIGSDIVPTTNYLEDYYFCGLFYKINNTNISILSISATTDLLATPSVVTIPNYIVLKYENFTLIKFASSITAEKLNISYRSGYTGEIPANLRYAISVKVGEQLDVTKNGYTSNNNQETKTWERLTAEFMNLLP